MKNQSKILMLAVTAAGVLIAAESCAFANGGPFLLKYPNGDPAAKGVLARLDPDLKPGIETRLRVVKEDLKIVFGREWRSAKNRTEGPPLVRVSAQYTIENPTDERVSVDFGFPILRGVYMDPLSMMIKPDVNVTLNKVRVKSIIISNSAIYGIIRQRSRRIIENAIAGAPELKKLVDSVSNTNGEDREYAREDLRKYLTGAMGWNERDSALMVEYAGLDFGKNISHPFDRGIMSWGGGDVELHKVMNENLGQLSAIGEQKATQFFAQLAHCFDAKATSAYEAIFAAWGGDVRERSVDIDTGKVRPREVKVDPKKLGERPSPFKSGFDPTIYARVDYLDPKARITDQERESCKAILKNLPVVFTFAPMNILHYQVEFPANSTQTLTVGYNQYAYSDTRSPSSYQLAYLVHPASFWKEFGPINLEVAVPEGVRFRASVPCNNGGIEERQMSLRNSEKVRFSIYKAVPENKTGELYFAVEAEDWNYAGKIRAFGDLVDISKISFQQAVKEPGSR